MSSVDLETLRFRDVLGDADRECMVVHDVLKEAVQRCSVLAGPFANVPLLMFPAFMVILTLYRLFDQERRLGLARPDLTSFRHQSYAYIDHVDVAEGLKVEEKEIGTIFDPPPERLPSGRRYALASAILGLLPNRAKVALFLWELGSDLPYELLRQGICAFVPPASRLGVPLAAQWPTVERAIDDICGRFGMERDARALKELLLAHSRLYLIEGKPEHLAVDALVVGNLFHIPNRTMAARARCSGIPVVTIAHGQGSGMVGDPVCGYGERTLATHELGYATAGMRDRLGMPNALSLIPADEPLGMIPSDAEKVVKLFRADAEIKPLQLGRDSRIYYVPTTFNDWHTYGPGRSMPDIIHARWQQHLLDQFPEAILKAYPWERTSTDWAYGAVDPARICRDRLEEVVDDADAFIFDYSSTSFLIACATDKPVVYFDVGLRDQSPLALQTIRERCIYIRVDRVVDPSLRGQVVARANERKVNRLTPTFSLEGLGEPRARSLVRGLKQILEREHADQAQRALAS